MTDNNYANNTLGTSEGRINSRDGMCLYRLIQNSHGSI